MAFYCIYGVTTLVLKVIWFLWEVLLASPEVGEGVTLLRLSLLLHQFLVPFLGTV